MKDIKILSKEVFLYKLSKRMCFLEIGFKTSLFERIKIFGTRSSSFLNELNVKICNGGATLGVFTLGVLLS